MKTSNLYSVPSRKAQSFKGVKNVVIPMQSMTLQEILRRFVKRESLPSQKEGVYEDRYDYDLEKLAKADRVEQDEVLSDLKTEVSRHRGRYDTLLKEREEALKQKDPKDPVDPPPILPPKQP